MDLTSATTLTLLLTLINRLGLLVACAFLLLSVIPVHRLGFALPQSVNKAFLIVLFGALGILGTYAGDPIAQSFANLRATAVITAGLFGGPLVGFGAGLIAGAHRMAIDLGGFSAVPCALATCIEGLAAGIVAARYRGDALNWKVAMPLTAVGETLHMLLVLAWCRPFVDALALVQVIALPMIIVNTLGASVFAQILSVTIVQRERRLSQHAQQILAVANQTVGHLRSGLNYDSARATAEIIYAKTSPAAVAITDDSMVLAHIGEGADHHLPGQPILTQATRSVLATGEAVFLHGRTLIGCHEPDCPFTQAIIVPLRKGSTLVGTLKLYGSSMVKLDQIRFELAKGLADLFSFQLELEDIQVKARLLSQAEIRHLQAQINPHFQFNALNTIAAFCQSNPKRARDLLVDLASYMRKNLASEKSFVPLSEELDQVRSYLAIEQARFGDRITVAMDVASDCRDWPIPPLIIQPLVENAVKHGLSGREEGGLVTLSVARADAGLDIRVRDNGVGMSPAQVRRIFSGNGVEAPSGGIGVKNCALRLSRIYGPQCRMHIESTPGQGTEVRMLIPPAAETALA
jgi:two-component system sensor histidine kinase LytS